MRRDFIRPCTRRVRSGARHLLLLLLALAAGQAGAQTVQLAARTNVGTGTFTYSMGNLDIGSDSITTSAPGNATTSAQIGTVNNPALPVTVTQAANAQYTLASAACVDTATGATGIGGLVGNTLTIAPGNLGATATLVCTFDNVQAAPDLAITKSANVGAVASGGTVTYSLVASNVGVVDVENAILSDVPGAGLSCTTPATCQPSNGATCPASLPPGDLFGAGVTVPSLPAGSGVTVTVSCAVTASGR